MLPAAGFLDRRATPHPRSAVEVKEKPGAGTAGVFQYKMSIEQDRFNFRKQRIVAIDMGPARLHHPNLWIGEVMDGAEQETFRRCEVSIEDGNELAFCHLHTFRQRTSFVAFAISAMV